MKPAHIRVFDGLRITTEHVHHLQTALRSGIEDLREIAGLGKVQRGLAVTVEGNQVTVSPGLAFDYQRNRIECDDPQSAPVSFASGEPAKYVCVKYQHVEDGKVEDQATLLFDSCSVVIQPALPEPKDNLVAIAKLVNGPDGIHVEPVERPAKPPAEQSAAPALRVRQGVSRLNGAVPQLGFSASPEPLAEGKLDLDFSAASITAHALVLANVTLGSPAPTPPGGAPAPPSQFRFECRADGEATLDQSGIAQFSISTCATADFSDRELARLFLEMPASSGLDALRSACIRVRLERNDLAQLKFVAALDWTVAPGSDAIKAMQDRKASFSWQALLAWKALGASA